MKKIIVVLLSILIIVVSIKGIMFLLDPPIHYALDKKSSSIRNDDAYNYGTHFKTFSVSGLLKFEYNSDDLTISYDGTTLSVNDKFINNVSSVYDYYAIYDNSVVVISYIVDDVSYLLFYNYSDDEEKIIDNYKEMVIDFDSLITFDDDGITVNFTSVLDGKFIKNGKDICKEKKKDKVVQKTVFYEYSQELKTLGEIKELYNMSLFNYLNKNNLCQSDK